MSAGSHEFETRHGILLSGFKAPMVLNARAPPEAPSDPAGELLGQLLDLAVPSAADEIA